MASEDLYEKLRKECHHKSYDCSAYRYIFEKRAKRLKSRVTLLKTFGVLVPATVGATALGYNLDNSFLKILILLAIPVTIIQFTISVWAIFYKWDDELAYSYEAIQSYNPLFTKYHTLATYPPVKYSDLKREFDLINVESSFRARQDALHNIKEWEERKGMRYSLREYQCTCVGCKCVPLSMESTECDICGKFSFKYQLLNH